jgi:hypothetical protein
MSTGFLRGVSVASIAIVVLLFDRAVAAPRPRFATPEAAVHHFVEHLAADDIDDAMQAFQIEDMLAAFDAAAHVRSDRGAALSDHRIMVGAAKISVMAKFAHETRQFVYGLLLAVPQAYLLTKASDESVQRFIRDVNPARLQAVRIVRIDRPAPSAMNSAEAVALAKRRAARYGAEDSTERIALFQLDGAYYAGGFSLLKSSDTWRISELESVYAGIGHRDYPIRKITVAEYEELIK